MWKLHVCVVLCVVLCFRTAPSGHNELETCSQKSSKNLQHKISLHQISRTFNHNRFNCNCCGYINNYIYMREKYLLIDVDGIFRYIWTRSDNVMISKYNPSYKMIICSTPSRMVRLYTTRLLTVWFHLEMFTCFTYFSSSWPR